MSPFSKLVLVSVEVVLGMLVLLSETLLVVSVLVLAGVLLSATLLVPSLELLGVCKVEPLLGFPPLFPLPGELFPLEPPEGELLEGDCGLLPGLLPPLELLGVCEVELLFELPPLLDELPPELPEDVLLEFPLFTLSFAFSLNIAYLAPA